MTTGERSCFNKKANDLALPPAGGEIGMQLINLLFKKSGLKCLQTTIFKQQLFFLLQKKIQSLNILQKMKKNLKTKNKLKYIYCKSML